MRKRVMLFVPNSLKLLRRKMRHIDLGGFEDLREKLQRHIVRDKLSHHIHDDLVVYLSDMSSGSVAGIRMLSQRQCISVRSRTLFPTILRI